MTAILATVYRDGECDREDVEAGWARWFLRMAVAVLAGMAGRALFQRG
jgi:hypothetical protein